MLRTVLTSFSVAWGIFMLVILLGTSNGLQNTVVYSFRDDAINSIWISPGKTSIPHKGLKPGRQIMFTNDDHEEIKNSIDGVEFITSRFNIYANNIISYKHKSGSFSIRSTHPEHRYLENTVVVRGRFLNQIDIDEKRKVAVIGELVKEDLFGSVTAIGKYVKVNGIPFKVVGIFEDEGSIGENRLVYIPISISQQVFNGVNEVHRIMLTYGDLGTDASQEMAGEIRGMLAENHIFSTEDRKAVHVRDRSESFARFQNVFTGMNFFIWFLGIGTLISGIVGVSNIMLILVKERTKEIGIRKAIGASPSSIVGLIIFEAIVITGIAGYLGLLAGVACIEFAFLENFIPEDYFRDPHVDFYVGAIATGVLVISGALAGMIPAVRAARIKTIIALREE